MREPELSIVLRSAAQLTDGERVAIRSLDREAFAGHPFTGVYTWAPDDHHVLATDAQGLAGHCAIVARVASQGGAPLRLGGVGTVMTRPALLRRGIAARVLTVAECFVFDVLAADAGLLFCVPEIVTFYERRGWRVLRAPVRVEQPGGTIAWPTPVMVLRRDRDRSGTDEPIDLCGLPW